MKMAKSNWNSKNRINLVKIKDKIKDKRDTKDMKVEKWKWQNRIEILKIEQIWKS